jgi:[protein-PII] uridylyltransferase
MARRSASVARMVWRSRTSDYTSAVSSSPPREISLEDFAALLPRRYRELFDVSAMRAHARVAEERAEAPAKVGSFPSRRPGYALCVVADDRPGLLATIAAAFVLTGLDVIDAEAFTRRRPDGLLEAVDLFWVRRTHEVEQTSAPVPLSDEDTDALSEKLVGLLHGSVRVPLPTRLPGRVPGAESDAVVRFIESAQGAFSMLEVEAGDRPGLLLALSQALFEQRIQIISCEARSSSGRVLDRFEVVERDGSPINPARRLDLQVAVLTAVETAMGRGALISAS